MIKTYAINIQNLKDKNLFNNLSCVAQNTPNTSRTNYKLFEDSFRSLVGEVLTRYLIKKYFHIPNSKINFSRNAFGKPFIIGYPKIHFSISHSGSWVICSISDSKIGSDVESTKPVDYKIAKYFFTDDEYETLMSLEESDKKSYFFKLWTLKESFIKAEGKGLNLSLKSFNFTSSENKILVSLKDKILGYFFKQYKLDEKSFISVCSTKDTFSPNVETYTLEHFQYLAYSYLGPISNEATLYNDCTESLPA